MDSDIFEQQASIGIQSISTATLAGVLSYLYLGNVANVSVAGFDIPPYLFMALIGAIAEYGQNTFKQGLQMVGIDNSKLETLGEFSDPFVVGLASSLLVIGNGVISTGSFSGVTLNSFLIPFLVGSGSSLVGGYVSNSLEPTVNDFL